MSWFFNGDYETFLFSGGQNYSFESSKLNQEFEYVIHFFEEEPVYTQKRYSEDYRRAIKALSGKEFETSQDPRAARPWCCPVGDLVKDRRLHSKATSARFMRDLGLAPETSVVTAADFNPSKAGSKEPRLFKREGELSGRGLLIWPKDEARIRKFLERGDVLVEEPLRNRTRDFSVLFLGPGRRIWYSNLVDRRFQYKGSVLEEPRMTAAQRNEHEDVMNKVESFYLALGVSYPFSADSYFYMEEGEEKLCHLSEVNARKTMGFAAWGLARYFDFKNSAFLILPNTVRLPKERAKGELLELSPPENMFKSVLLGAREPETLERELAWLLAESNISVSGP